MRRNNLIALSCLVLSCCQAKAPQKPELTTQLDSLPPSPIPPPKKSQRPPLKRYPAPFYRKVSLIVNESVSLKRALFSLAQHLGIDIHMPASLDKSLLFSVHNQPFIHVIETLCDLANWRFSLVHGGLRIEEDTPYLQNYTVPFLNFMRTSQHHIAIATDVFSQNTDTSKGLENGSNSQIMVKGESDFWQEVKANLQIILENSSFTVHQQGGVISILATSKKHTQVARYLESLRKATLAQVLIEAKVIEVHLKDEFKSGINWQRLMGEPWFLNIPLGDMALRSSFLSPHSGQGELLSVGYHKGNFTSLLKIIEEFGHCKILSSPRLTVMNNQVAILKAAQNQVYFRLHYDKQLYVNAQRENISVTSDIQTVPEGWVLTVQPSIDPYHQSVLMALRPTISRLSHSVPDPAVEMVLQASNSSFASQSAKPSLVPVMEVREIESVLRLQSGETAILGGLMETRSTQNKSQLPVLGDLHLIGPLFQAQTQSQEVVELVILLKATILDAPQSLDSP